MEPIMEQQEQQYRVISPRGLTTGSGRIEPGEVVWGDDLGTSARRLIRQGYVVATGESRRRKSAKSTPSPASAEQTPTGTGSAADAGPVGDFAGLPVAALLRILKDDPEQRHAIRAAEAARDKPRASVISALDKLEGS